jgi:hypothetical protein
MVSATVAQWALARVSTRERASAVVGDLLEQHTSTVGFWFAAVRVGAALTWRWILAIGLSAASFFVVLLPYSLIVQSRWDLIHPQPWMRWAMYLAGAASCMGTSTAVAASLYGMRDRLTKMCAVLWMLVTASALTAWLPRASWVIGVVMVATFAVTLTGTKSRGPLVCALASAAAYALTYIYFGRLLDPLERVVLVHVLHLPAQACCNNVHGFSPQVVARATLEMAFAIATWLTSILSAALVLSHLRRRLLSSPPLIA